MKTRAPAKGKASPKVGGGTWPRKIASTKVQKRATKTTTSKVTLKATTLTTTKATASKPSTKSQTQTGTRTNKWSANYRECEICAEEIPVGRGGSNFPQLASCEHEPLTCYSCILKHVTNTLKTRVPVASDGANGEDVLDWSICTCPQCNGSISEADVRSALSRKGLAELNDATAKMLLESNPRWVWCAAANCSSGQIFPEGQKPEYKVTCIKCGAHTCFFHRIPWHNGYTCTQYDDRHPDAESLRSSEERIKRISKKCPTRGCGWRIQKDGGCSHMYCPKCGKDFHWDRVKYDDNITPEPENNPLSQIPQYNAQHVQRVRWAAQQQQGWW